MAETKARFLANLIGADNTANDFTLPNTAVSGTDQKVLTSGGDGTVTWEETQTPPTISSVSPTTFNGESGASFTITGANFDSTCVVKFVTSGGTEYTAGSLTRNIPTTLTATTPQNFTVADEPLDVKVINGASSLTAILADAIDCGGLPSWTGLTTSHTIYDSQRVGKTIQFTATDPESQTITYARTSGSLPAGMSLSSSGLLSGTSTAQTSDTDFTFKITATDASGNATQSGDITVTVKAPVETTYSYTGSLQTLSVPTGITQMEAWMWGAGGGGGNKSTWGHGYAGGAGGFAYGKINTTSISTLAIVVGGGGEGAPTSHQNVVAGGYGGGGNTERGSSNTYVGAGGGLSGIFNGSYTHSNSILIAGGGGGGGCALTANGGGPDTGGAGGGTTGQAGEYGGSRSHANSGYGGTQSAGGASDGAALQGAVGDGGGQAGAGGGYYGGGHGTYDSIDDQPGSGGGSGYYDSSIVSSATLTGGDGTTPGNSSNSKRNNLGDGGAGSGASNIGGTDGDHGIVVIVY